MGYIVSIIFNLREKALRGTLLLFSISYPTLYEELTSIRIMSQTTDEHMFNEAKLLSLRRAKDGYDTSCSMIDQLVNDGTFTREEGNSQKRNALELFEAAKSSIIAGNKSSASSSRPWMLATIALSVMLSLLCGVLFSHGIPYEWKVSNFFNRRMPSPVSTPTPIKPNNADSIEGQALQRHQISGVEINILNRYNFGHLASNLSIYKNNYSEAQIMARSEIIGMLETINKTHSNWMYETPSIFSVQRGKVQGEQPLVLSDDDNTRAVARQAIDSISKYLDDTCEDCKREFSFANNSGENEWVLQLAAAHLS